MEKAPTTARGPVWSQLEHAFAESQPASWRRGWQIVYDIGPPLAPLLWQRQQDEHNVRARLVWLAAYALAAGPAASDKLLDPPWLRQAHSTERLLALLEIATSEWPLAEAPDPRDLLTIVDQPSTRIAAALALSRLDSPTALPRDWFGQPDPDPGLVAAASMCGGAPKGPHLQRWLKGDPSEPATALVWRAVFLSRFPPIGDERTAMALRAVGLPGEANAAIRDAAALALVRAQQPFLMPAGTPEPDVLLVLVSDAAMRQQALDHGWLEEVPSPRLPAATRATLVVAYVLSAPAEALQSAIPRWTDAELGGPAALAIALRMASGELKPGAWMEPFATMPEGQWLALAAGQRLPAGAPAAGGPSEEVRRLAAEDRLPRTVVARLIEEELWHRGFHPGRAPFLLRLGLVADCLLAGSDYARSVQAAERFPYLPADLTPSDSFFEVAYELYEWHASTTDGVPVKQRLVR